jgi:glutamine amidotransferase
VLVHVGQDLEVTRTTILDGPPRHQLTLADLGATAAASQHP